MRDVARSIFDVFEVYLPALIFFVLILSVAVEVFFRYVFNYPIPELFEISIYAFVWTIYLGAALAKRYNQHIRFDLLYSKLPPKVRLALDIFFDTVTSLVFILLLIPSIRYTIINYNIKASALRIPWTFLLMCFPIFVLLIILHNSISTFLNVRELLGKGVRRTEKPPWR